MGRFVVANNKVVEQNEVNIPEIVLTDFSKISCKIWFGFGGIPFFRENIEILIHQLTQLKTNVPTVLFNTNEIFRLTKRMLNKNKFYRSGYVNASVFFNQNNSHLIFTSENFETNDFPMAENGILLTVSDLKKPLTKEFASMHYVNQTITEILKARITNPLANNAIILNEQDKICQCIEGNIFCIRDNQLITPSLASGCQNYTTRQLVLDCAIKTGFIIKETDQLKLSELFVMNEIFVVSESLGFKWVLGVNEKRYVRNKVKQIWEIINTSVKNKVV